MKKIFITGCEGLLGQTVRNALEAIDYTVAGCDLRALRREERYDFRDAEKLTDVLSQCSGIIHFGAVSRVVWGYTHPDLCRDINVDGLQTLAKTVSEMPHKIWLIFASSREVYGNPPKLPCTSDMPLCPENEYARTKLAGEKIIWQMRASGLPVAVVRFSNVFGTVNDYPDRVVPAFASAAAKNGVLEVRGPSSMLDFTPLNDAVRAVLRTVHIMDKEHINDLPAIDIVTGRATSLMELAKIALSHGGGDIRVKTPNSLYPSRFQGDPSLAERYLGWSPQDTLEDAVGELVEKFRQVSEEVLRDNAKHNWLNQIST